jgi:hypothetical protein
MSQLNRRQNESKPDNIYYDLTITNFQSTVTQPPIFYYNDDRTTAYLDKPEDYELSIIRFVVDCPFAPVFIPSIVPNQGNPDLTIYTITMTWQGFTQVQPVIWVPQDKSILQASPPNQNVNGLFDNSQGYYNCYSYQFFIYQVTRCMQLCFTNLKAQTGGALTAEYPPYMTWDTSNDRAVISADTEWYDQNPQNPFIGNIIKMFFNAPLYSLFNSFPSNLFGYVGVQDGKNALIAIANISNLNATVITVPYLVDPVTGLPVTYTAIQSYQEYSTISSWSPIQAIVFTSNTMPINPNLVSPPLIFNNGQIIQSTSNNSSTSNIITDVVSNTGQYAPSILYEPSAEYRMITLYGNAPLTNIDIEIFYRVRDGSLVPFTLASGASVSMKIAFIKKKK